MFSLRRMSSMLRNTNAKQGSKSKAGEYKLDASRWENRKLYYKNFRIKRKIRWWIPIDGVAFVFLWWRRAKNERRTGVLALRLWRGNQRRLTLYNISDLSFYTFWECAWNIFERIREAWGEGNGSLQCILLQPSLLWSSNQQTVFFKPLESLFLDSLLGLLQLVLGLFSLVKKHIFG